MILSDQLTQVLQIGFAHFNLYQKQSDWFVCLFVTEEIPIQYHGMLQTMKLGQAPITIVPNS